MAPSNPYRVHPEPAKRLVVRRGYATLSTDRKRIKKYDLEQLARLWEEWPNLSAVDFGRHWGIPYDRMADPNYPFSVAKKRAAMMDMRRDWRQAVIQRAAIPDIVTATDEEAALRVLITQLREIGQAGLGYAHAKLIRKSEGTRYPNTALQPREARDCIEIGQKASQIIAVYAGIKDLGRGADDEPGARTQPVFQIEAKSVPA